MKGERLKGEEVKGKAVFLFALYPLTFPLSFPYSSDLCVEASPMVVAHLLYCDADEIASVGCVFIERTIAHRRTVNFNRTGGELERDLQRALLACDVIPANVNRGQD